MPHSTAATIVPKTAPGRIPAVSAPVRFDGIYDSASIALFGLAAVLVLFTYRDYGITWDEPVHRYYGLLIDRFYYYLFHGRYDISAIVSFRNLYMYGGAFDGLGFVVTKLSPLGLYETRHLLNAIAGLLGVAGAWKLSRLLGGPKAAFWTALLLLTTPRYFGHMFNNPKDIPFATGYIWSLYYLACAIPTVPAVPGKLVVKLICSIGFALGVRVAGVLLLGYMALLLAVCFWFASSGKPRLSGNKRLLYEHARLFFVIATGAWLLMALFWPWVQISPFSRPVYALKYFARFPWPGSVLFDGALIKAMDVPRTYTLHWFAITLPEAILLLVLVAAPVALWRALHNLRQFDRSRVLGVALASASVMLPVAYGLIARPALYDAERHSLYVIPPLICLSALAWTFVSNRLAASSRPAAARAAAALLLIAAGANGYLMVRLHPYEYVFFNQIAGGLPGAAGRYETDYWLSSYREAVQLLDKHLAATATAAGVGPDRTYKVYMASTEREAASYYFPKNVMLANSPQEADFFLASTRYRVDESIQAPVIARVQRFGVPFAVIKDLRNGYGDMRLGPSQGQ